MGLFTGIEISGSGLTAQHLRLDIIASNIANAETTRSGEVDAAGKPLPYRRQTPVFEGSKALFADILEEKLRGVRVKEIAKDDSPFRKIYQPGHPDADEQGYVMMPNVNLVEEMVDLISAGRSYEANATVLDAVKNMALRALDIGRR